MTPHNQAAMGAFAPVVLLPGDPLRAQFVAKEFFDNAKQVTATRNVLGYTGTYRNTPVSVMASGMGGPSAGIYAYELFTHYGVEAIIRIGTCGGLVESQIPGDLIFALTASTDSAWAHQYQLKGTYSPVCDYSLLNLSLSVAKEKNYRFQAGMVFSSDLFSDYSALGANSWKPWADMGALAQDMETYALYSTAAKTKKIALSILTMTDSCVTGVGLPDNQRMSALEPMIRTALECATAVSL